MTLISNIALMKNDDLKTVGLLSITAPATNEVKGEVRSLDEDDLFLWITFDRY